MSVYTESIIPYLITKNNLHSPIQTVKGRVVFFRTGREKISTLKPLTKRFMGGALSSIQDKDGVEYLWQGDPAYWSGQAPVLFPICGSLRGDTAHTETGKILKMPRHGIVRKREFVCTHNQEDRIVFHIESKGVMLEQFPWRFCRRENEFCGYGSLNRGNRNRNLYQKILIYFLPDVIQALYCSCISCMVLGAVIC